MLTKIESARKEMLAKQQVLLDTLSKSPSFSATALESVKRTMARAMIECTDKQIIEVAGLGRQLTR